MLWTKRKNSDRGQSLVEFAIVSIVLLLILFLIIEVGRVMWAWITVQNAAREGARYAITGNYDASCLDDVPACDDPRYTSVVAEVKKNLAGLPLSDDPDATYEDDFAYFIEVYGVNTDGVLQENFAGVAQQPMAVRVIYNVPIIVPILSGIAENIPVMGQVVEYNERFGSLGSTETGISVAPALPAIPTVGPTPTPTITPLPTSTITPTMTSVDYVSPTPTNTATITPSPTPIRCNVQILLINGANYNHNDSIVEITGDIGTTVTLYDLTAGSVELASGVISNAGSDECEGFIELTASPLLQGDHVILAQSSDGSFDTIIVDAAVSVDPNTPTTTPQPTSTATPIPSLVPSATHTATPIGEFLLVSPDCGFGPDIEFSIRGFNWDDTKDIVVYFNGVRDSIIPAGHGGSFQQNRQKFNLTDGTYQIRAESGSGADLSTTSTTIELPCTNVTATPTIIAPTETPEPADLIVVGAPTLLAPAEVVAYQPVTFTVVISNDGDLDVESQFFVDLYFDPPDGSVEVEGINVAYSNAYLALSGLEAQASKSLTIHAPLGFTVVTTNPHPVYAMVDSILQIEEKIETNNVSTRTEILVTPASTPTPFPTIDPTNVDTVAGEVRILLSLWIPQRRAQVFLIADDGTTETLLQQTSSDLTNAAYVFNNVPPPPSRSYL